MSGAIILADVSARTDVLVVARTRCERAGRYRLDTLIARHGPACGIPALLRQLSGDCPKCLLVSAYDLCGIHCPELSTLFLGSTPAPTVASSSPTGGK
jgi:hypothetical protein